MKKTLNINLGQRPFIIDEDAFDILDDYLCRLEAMFAHQDSTIVADIEHRFSEILVEKVGPNQIINTHHIEQGIDQIGRPESIAGHEDHTEHEATSDPSSILYRSSDSKVIGGVASGIAHYFGIKESLWVRLVFVLTLFTPITLLYIMLWAVLPARPLRGQPLQDNSINTIISTMTKEVKHAILDLKKSFVNMQS